MEKLHILVTNDIGGENIRKIEDADTRVRVTEVTELVRADREGDADATKQLDDLLAEAEVFYGFWLPRDPVSRTPNLKWVQVLSAGVERYLRSEIMDSPVILTNASGIHAVPIGEFVIEQMLMFVKKAPEIFRLQDAHKWVRVNPTGLRDKTVGIVGLGNIGREVARLSKAFGMKVIATRRGAKQPGKARYVDTVLPSSRLSDLLGESDFVVLSLPFTPETEKIIGEKELRMMKPSAFLINIARGGVVDEDALLNALEEKKIAGAGLDVFATEPLPSESRLWDMENVIVSPHMSGNMDDYIERATDLFVKNLERYLAGKRMLTVVDKKKGY